MEKILTINGKKVSFDKERNLLEVIRKANIELPTFCYHSELSTYGACRLCLVNVEKRGLVPACSTPAEAGMVVVTNSKEIRELRKIIVELLLANHDTNCTSCHKSESCQLQTLARRLGIQKVRYKKIVKDTPKDESTPSLVRDPNKCVLCGDCVRFCEEIQSIGAIDFSFRGSNAQVSPSFGRDLNFSDCVYCGQCSRVCPTGALTIKSNVSKVWSALGDKSKKVIVSIAPAVRAAISEAFGINKMTGTEAAGKMVTALKSMGFFKVFDVSFAADLTIVEEANEFVERFTKGEKLPQFTSCCPAWVKFSEQYFPDMLPHLSTCRSPQGMFGSLAKKMLPDTYGIKREDLITVSVMPCTAKKFEATRPELSKDGIPDTDIVLTTQELARMIEESGLSFAELEQSAFDMPLGFKTGGGVIFGNTGGVTEAVLRNVLSKENSNDMEEFAFIRGNDGIKEANLKVGDKDLRIAVVYGLGNARKVVNQIKTKEKEYDLIEVMACPGGCIGGAGQPVYDKLEVRNKRTKCLYENDSVLELHKPQDNPYVKKIYDEILGKIGGKEAHECLHTHYNTEKYFNETPFVVKKATSDKNIKVNVCLGVSCTAKGSKELLKSIINLVETKKLDDKVEIQSSFCFEKCTRGPVVRVGTTIIEKADIAAVEKAIKAALK